LGFAGLESRHNLKYWQRQPYCGFGAGAHSFNGRQRWPMRTIPPRNVTTISQGRFPIEQLAHVSRDEALEEELFLGLRQLGGSISRASSPSTARFAASRRRVCAHWDCRMERNPARLSPDRLTVSNEVFVNLLN